MQHVHQYLHMTLIERSYFFSGYISVGVLFKHSYFTTKLASSKVARYLLSRLEDFNMYSSSHLPFSMRMHTLKCAYA